MPDVELRNDADFAVVLKGARIESDYDVTYGDNTDAGTAKATVTFKGNYVGEKELAFKIAKADISDATVTVSAAEYDYTGKTVSPSVTVALGGKTRAAGTDYELTGTFSASEAGSYTVGAAGKGNYTGTTTATAAWKIKEPLEVSGYWLAPAGVDDPSKYGIKTKEQIAADVKAIKAGNAAVTAEYTTYMQDDDVHLYTKWNAATGEAESAVTTGKNAYVEFRIIQVGAHDGDGSGLTFMAVHALPAAKKMNASITNAGGWASSAMRTTVFGSDGYVQTGLKDLESAAMTVTKKATSDSSGSWDENGTTEDKF